MSTKICTRCRKSKPLAEFSSQKRSKTGLNPACKQCVNEYHKVLYQKSPERRKYLRTKDVERTQKTKQWLWDYLATHPCIGCGENDPIVLEFDHRDRITKSFTISSCVHLYGLNKIKEEVEKCDVRCANCHRRKTAIDFGWYASVTK